MRRALSLLVVAFLELPGCGSEAVGQFQQPEGADAELLARYLAEGVAAYGGNPDPLFHAFGMGDSAFYEELETWECLYRPVVAARQHGPSTGVYGDLVALARRDSPPLYDRSYAAQIVFSRLSRAEGVRLGEVALAAAAACGDIRIGMFGGGGPLPVCGFDQALDEGLASEVIALGITQVPGDDFDYPPQITSILEHCYTTLSEAWENDEEPAWVSELERAWRARQEAQNRDQ
ncbi:MAG: hypothetical protein ABIJ48_00155 [Actinomycetota bacterium]